MDEEGRLLTTRQLNMIGRSSADFLHTDYTATPIPETFMTKDKTFICKDNSMFSLALDICNDCNPRDYICCPIKVFIDV